MQPPPAWPSWSGFPPAPAQPGTDFQQLASSSYDQVDAIVAGLTLGLPVLSSALDASESALNALDGELAAGLSDLSAQLDLQPSYDPTANLDAVLRSLETFGSAGANAAAGLAGDPDLGYDFGPIPGAPSAYTPPPSPPTGGGGGTGGSPGGGTPPVLPPLGSGPCPPGFTASKSGCVSATGTGPGLPPILPPVLGGAGGAEGGGVVLPGAAGTITTVLNTVIPVVGAFLLFNYVFNIPNFDSQLAALQAYMINWFETDPLAAELYVAQQQLAALQAQLASFPAGQAARTQLLNVIAMQQNQVNALVAQIRKQGIPKLPKS